LAELEPFLLKVKKVVYLADVTIDMEVLLHGHDPDRVGGALHRGDPVAAGRTFWSKESEKRKKKLLSKNIFYKISSI
jgi:hypothetical protein